MTIHNSIRNVLDFVELAYVGQLFSHIACLVQEVEK